MTRKLALNIAAVALALAGCDGGGATGTEFAERDFVCPSGSAAPCATTEPRRAAGDRTRPEGEELDPGNQTLVYVVNLVTIPRAQEGRIPGFNLDGIDTGEADDPADEDCRNHHRDYRSTVDSFHVGVDNNFGAQVAPLLAMFTDTDLDATVLEQINEGNLILMVQVTGVDSLRFDSSVQVQLLLGEIDGGAAPQVTAEGRLAPGQSFNVTMNVGSPVMGDIYDGRLRARTSVLTLALEIMGMALALQISEPELRFDITSSGLANGVIGGFITVASIIDALRMIPDLADIVGTAEGLLNQYADVQPSSADPGRCEALSVGLAFEATTATAVRP